MPYLGFKWNQEQCIGCNACQVACKDKYNLEAGCFFRRADTIEVEENGVKRWKHLSVSCHHCPDAACMKACPTDSICRTEEGLVVVRQSSCVGCGKCVRACEQGAIFLSRRTKKAAKCDGCVDLLHQGKLPACVSACPTHCLELGEHDYAQSPEILKGFCINPISKTVEKKEVLTECSVEILTAKEKICGKSEENPVSSSEKIHHPADIPQTMDFERAAAFFASKEEALKQLAGCSDWAEHTEKEWSLMYDYLFRGTDADRTVPLWASTSNGENILLNETTLAVIQFYHKWGYEPVGMEGNPPDYIGEMFAFSLYLVKAAAWEEKNEDKNQNHRSEILAALRQFTENYTLPTLEAIVHSVNGWGKDRETYGGLKEYLSELLETLRITISDNRVRREESSELLHRDIAVSPQPFQRDIAVSPQPLQPAIADEPVHVMNTAGINNCGGICVIRPTVQENCILRIETDCGDHDPQIRACVRGHGYRKTFLHSGRLRYPMKRVGKRGSGKFERISWKEAMDLLMDNWIRIRDSYGPGSRFRMYGTGVEGIMRPNKQLGRLLSLDGGFLDYYNSYSSACVSTISGYVFGTTNTVNSNSDLLNTKLLILWADNSAESIFGAERNFYLAQLKAAGVKIIVIDPRLSQTGIAYADEWYEIHPSTDAALADAMAYVIWSEGLQDQAFMDRYCLGFDEEHMPEGIPAGESYHSYLFGKKDGVCKTPEWAEPITGISAHRIRNLARRYAAVKPACIAAGLGAQRHGNGEQSARGIMMLSCLTGNVGIHGGGTGGNASDIAEREGIALFNNRIQNPYPGEIPVFTWTKAVEHGVEMIPEEDGLKGVDHLETNIKMIFNLASDCLINQHSNIHDTIRILQDESLCEFIVCSDLFMTPSARYADLILPATSVFEGENIVNPWTGRNYILKNNQVICPLFECRFEWEWLKEAAERLGFYEEFIDGKPEISQWLRENYEIMRKKEPELPDYETFSAKGGWQYNGKGRTVAFEEEIRDPENHPFPTPSGKIEIFSKELYDRNRHETIPAIPRYVPCMDGPEDEKRNRYPLQLIGWHTRRRCHTIHDNNAWMDEIEMPGVWMHPVDAEQRGIQNRDMVIVYNDYGKIQIPAIVTNRIRPGVTAISQGGWYTPDENGTDQRGSINVLTGSQPTPLAKGNPQHTNLVEIRKIGS
ncbi:MAG: DMSO/selenate family reductase complex A subunit [Lachnospiraceae bacterium]